MTEFHKPTTLYDIRLSGDYTGWACSERDPYAPRNPVVYWVNIDGGAVCADVLDADTLTTRDPAHDRDAWVFEVETGLAMTANEVLEALT